MVMMIAFVAEKQHLFMTIFLFNVHVLLILLLLLLSYLLLLLSDHGKNKFEFAAVQRP